MSGLAAALASSGQFPSITATLSNFHGKNISCNGAHDGAIDITVTGGTPPYTYVWNTGATTQDISGLVAGSYNVVVTDAAGKQKPGGWVLQEADRLSAGTTAYEYPNGYNVSCNACFNGSINATVSGGVTPYTYAWTDGATTEDRSSIGMGNYQITVTDVNGCTLTSSSIYLSEPERTDWTMNGNAGTNPATQYIGTSDNKDVVFKSNGVERLRLLSNGDVRASTLSFSNGYRLLMADSLGTVKAMDITAESSKPCPSPVTTPWVLCGNTVNNADGGILGTNNMADLIFVTQHIERMRINKNGKVGIGCEPPDPSTSLYQLYVHEGIATRDVKVTINAFPDYVFDPGYALMPMTDLRGFLNTQKHLPGIPSAQEVAANEGVEIGDLQTRMLRTVEEQALYILSLKSEVDALKARLAILEGKQ